MKVQFLFNVEMKEPKKDVLGGVGGIFTERIPLYHRHDYVIFVYKCL